MKKAALASGVFAVVFVFTFALLSSGLKLSADPVVYFIEGIKHMFLLKSIVSLAAGLVAGVVAFIGRKEVRK